MTQSLTEQLFDYWKSRRSWNRAPERVDIVPSDLGPELLPSIFILQSGSVTTFRLVGTDVCRTHGCELTGSRFRDLFSFTDLPLIDREVRRVFSEQVVLQIETCVSAHNETADFQTIILPLINGEEGCTRAIGAQFPKRWPASMGHRGDTRLSAHSVIKLTERAWQSAAILKDPRLQPPAYEVPVFEFSRRGRPPENGRKIGHLTVIEGGAA